MKRYLLVCKNRDCDYWDRPYAVYSKIEPMCCHYCGCLISKVKGFNKVKGIPVSVALERGIYKAPFYGEDVSIE